MPRPEKLLRSGGLPLWQWGCWDCDSLTIQGDGEARAVVGQARAHTRKTGHPTWLHNILMWTIEPERARERTPDAPPES